jgi:creatinine amidohydrolase/Fe(II)-dependent formamide hydrolase-like protein
VGYPAQATAQSGQAMLEAAITRVVAVTDQLLALPLA